MLTHFLPCRFVALCAAILFNIAVITAQTERNDDLGNSMDDKSAAAKSLSIVQPQGMAFESTVNPETYFVGPSDMIAVNIWVSPPLNFSLSVSPEGTLIIPGVGEARVAGLTLAAAKDSVRSQIRKKFKTPEVTVTLIRPRSIIVNVLGNVEHPGVYTLTSIDHANRAIAQANLLERGENSKLKVDGSLRNIVLRHNDGTLEHVDISKYLATKDAKWNPFLREGDVVVVPDLDTTKNVIGVYGAVNSPGRFEFVQGDSLMDAVNMAQGLNQFAIADSAVLSHLNAVGGQAVQIVDLNALKQGTAPNPPLQPGDRLVVKSRSDSRADFRVFVSGEVLYPGTYPITKEQTRLSDVIAMAGGFTPYASLPSSEVVRSSSYLADVETERLLSLRGGVSTEDSLDYYAETDLRLRHEIVNVNFDKLYNGHDTSQDIGLQNDDQIVIPSIQKTIYVFGQVISPGNIPYVQGEDVSYYIRKAGGFTDRARQNDVRIIKSKTKQWIEPGQTPIEQGDYVWVPKDPDRPFIYYSTIASQAAAVLSVVIGVGVLIVQLTKQ